MKYTKNRDLDNTSEEERNQLSIVKIYEIETMRKKNRVKKTGKFIIC